MQAKARELAQVVQFSNFVHQTFLFENVCENQFMCFWPRMIETAKQQQ
jgi:hypothetical protein